MSNPLGHLQTQYPNPAPVTTATADDQLIRAILSVTEAASQSDNTNQEFSFYRIDACQQPNNANLDRRIWRRKKNILFPWTRHVKGAETQLLLVHALFADDGGTAEIHFYSTSHVQPRLAQYEALQADVTGFLQRGAWFDAADDDQLPAIAYTWTAACRSDDTARKFTVVLIAVALTLGLEFVTKDPKWTDQQKMYAQAVVASAVQGQATPALLLALLCHLKVVKKAPAFGLSWGQELFGSTVDLRGDGEFDVLWQGIGWAEDGESGDNGDDGDDGGEKTQTTPQDIPQDRPRDQPPADPQVPPATPQDQQQNGEQPACSKCDVASHCPKGSGVGRRCTHCPVENHCGTCVACPTTSHCIPDIANEARRGNSYLRSIHAFRAEYPQAKHDALHHPNVTAPVHPNSRFCIRLGMPLFDDAVVMAIMAVTEAISLNGRGHTFSMFGQLVHSMATYPEGSELRPAAPDQRTDVARRRRDLILPIVSSDPNNHKDTGHTVLAVVVEDESGTDYTVDVYDSTGPKRQKPGQIDPRTGKSPPPPQVSGHRQQYVRDFIRKTRWWTDNTTHPLPRGRFVVQYAATQTDGLLACGIHTILNAWAVALGLPINDANPQLARLGLAVEAITYAAHGIIDCRTICQLLHRLHWVRPGAAPPRDRQFKRTVFFPAPQVLDEYHSDLWLAEQYERTWGPRGAEELDYCDQCTVQGHCYAADGKLIPTKAGASARLRSSVSPGASGFVERMQGWGRKRPRAEMSAPGRRRKRRA